MTGRGFAGKHVVVTGAASGIGRAVAIAAAARGSVVHLTDRNSQSLEETAATIRAAGGQLGVVQSLDIRDLDQVRQLADAVHAEIPHVDIVMNIAGISAWGAVERLEHRHWRDMIEVNLMGPIHVIEAFVPTMIKGGNGGNLVNVSSAAGLLGLPWHAAYSASKFGLRGVSEVLRFDLRPHGIAVSLVCPGGVHTPLTETVEVAGVDTTSDRFRWFQQRFRRRAVSPERAAESIIEGVTARRYLIYTSRDIQLLYLLQRVAPPVYATIMRVMNVGMRRAMRTAS